MRGLKSHEFTRALQNVRSILSPTPLTYSPLISELTGIAVYLKWDNKFATGSFKERGAVNFLMNLTPPQQRRGVCAASAGNHALALSYHAARLKIPCTIVMPIHAPLVKIKRTEHNGATVILHGASFDDANVLASQIAKKQKLTIVPAFNHKDIILGQATCAMEILDQCMDFDGLIAPIGGGGLLSGVSSYLSIARPDCYIAGVQSAWAKSSRQRNDKRVLKPLSIADGIAVKQIGPLTKPILEQTLDKLITVDEHDISRAIVTFLEMERAVVEGAGAASLAGLLKVKLPKRIKSVVLLVCGSNIDVSVLARVIEQSRASAGEILKVTISVPDRPGSLSILTSRIAELGANILEVTHDRSFTSSPRAVNVELTLEVRDSKHGAQIVRYLSEI